MFPISGANARGHCPVSDPESANTYLSVLVSLMESSRLNDFFPSAAALASTFEALCPAVHQGLYGSFDLNLRAGLPVFKELVRAKTDRDVAAEELPRLLSRRSGVGAIYERLSAKRAYYTHLLALPIPFEEKCHLAFRKIDPRSQMAMFRIVLDRVLPEGTYGRVTVELRQRAATWGREGLSLSDRDVVEISDHLRGLVYRLSTLEPPYIFVRLEQEPGIDVDAIYKGVIGPFVFSNTLPLAPFDELVPLAANGALLTSSLSTASTEQRDDVANDPLFCGFSLSRQARREYEGLARGAAFHLLADRKFAGYRIDREQLLGFCDRRGTRNPIYEITD